MVTLSLQYPQIPLLFLGCMAVFIFLAARSLKITNISATTCLFSGLISKQGKRVIELLAEDGIAAAYLDNLNEVPLDGITVVSGDISEGFSLADDQLLVLSDKEMFGERLLRGTFKQVAAQGVDRSLLFELGDGDFVVHENYGIGIYRGLKKLTFDNVEQEYLLIEFADTDKLYVPLSQMGLVEKYSSSHQKFLKPFNNQLPVNILFKVINCHLLLRDRFVKIRRRRELLLQLINFFPNITICDNYTLTFGAGFNNDAVNKLLKHCPLNQIFVFFNIKYLNSAFTCYNIMLFKQFFAG